MRWSVSLILVATLVLQSSVPVMFTSAQGNNSPPTVSLISPVDKAVIHNPTPTFSWKAEDPDGDQLTFDLHVRLYDEMPHIGGPIVENIDGMNYTLTKPLVPSDRNYVWYVVPHDGHSTQDVYVKPRQFIVEKNTPPEIFPIPDQNITLGDDLRFNIDAQDMDPEDRGNLTFGLENAPQGVNFDPVNLTFRWRPREDQLGNYIMNVTVSDNYITIKESIKIKVSSEEKKPNHYDNAHPNNVWILWSLLAILLIAGCVFMFKGLKSDKKASMKKGKQR